MAVNKQFSGNVVDVNDQPLSNIRYRGYHVNSNTWSDWYYTNTDTQYNLNLGDASWLTQDGVVNTNDIILLVFETLETNPINRVFSMLRLVIASVDYYITDTMLLSVQEPVIQNKWYLESIIDGNEPVYLNDIGKSVYIGRINEPIVAYATPDTLHTWYYKDVLHYQIETYYSQDIFKDRIAISSIEYNYDNSYSTSNNYTYTKISNNPPKYNDVYIRVTNIANKIVIDNLPIQIRYNQPTITMSWTPNKPNVFDTFIISNTSEDIDDTIVNIDYLFDNTLVTSNKDITYSWTQDLLGSYTPKHSIKFIVTWSDGFYNNILEASNDVYMVNIPPTINIEINKLTDTSYRFIPTNINDPDGDDALINIKWILEHFNTLTDAYDIVYVKDYPSIISQSPIELDITAIGDYRMSIYGKDNYGLVGSDSELFTVTATACEGSSGKIILEPGKKLLVSLPITDGYIYQDFISKIDAIIKTYDNTRTVKDVIKYVSRYDELTDSYLTYIPNFTNKSSKHNFKLVDNNNGINIIYGIYIVIKDYSYITNDIITLDWKQG